jgi:hypothetical protein
MPDSTPEVDPLTQIRVESGNPKPEHSAAAIAVVAGMLREGGAVEEETHTDGWTRSVRTPRASIAGMSWSNSLR